MRIRKVRRKTECNPKYQLIQSIDQITVIPTEYGQQTCKHGFLVVDDDSPPVIRSLLSRFETELATKLEIAKDGITALGPRQSNRSF